MKQNQIFWIVAAIVAAIFLNRKYPFNSSPFWFWNRPADVVQQGPGYGNSNDEGFEE